MVIGNFSKKVLAIHYLKILSFYVIGYFLASYYRPFQNKEVFFDFGLADSGVAFVSLVSIYLILTPPNMSQFFAKRNALYLLFVYLSQEVYCLFFPGFVGTFDFKDIVYCVLGFIFVYWGDVLRRSVI